MATNPMNETALVNNGAMSKSLTSGKAQVINIAPGDHYRIVENQNGKLALKDNLVAKRVGDDLVVTYADGTKVIFEDYFVACADQSCSATFAADEAAGYDLPADATGAATGDGSSMVYAHGNSETLMGMAQGNSAMSSALTAGTLDAGLLTYIPAGAGMGMGVGLLGLAGAGVAAGGGGGGGGSTPDTTPPEPPAINDPTVNNDGTITITGTAEPGTTVTVTFPDGTTKTVETDPDGNYGPVTSDGPQPDGPIKAIATDPAGNPSEPTTSVLDTTAPEPPVIDDPTVNDDGTITITGTAEPGTTVTVTLPDGTTIDDIPVGPDGTYGPVTSDDPQQDGPIKAIATDPAGNPSEPTTSVLDTTPPAKPTLGDVLDDQGAVTGALSDGDTTDDTQPEVQVPLGADVKAGDTIKLYDGTGAVIGEHVVTPAEITAQTASVTPTTPLADGDHTLSVGITDVAGNESDKSDPINITVDTTEPAKPSLGDVLDDQGAVTGALSDGDTTDDTQPEVQVPLGADVKAGDTIKLYDGTGAVIGEHVVTPAEITAQTASVTPTTPLADGDHTLSVGIIDVAGNESDKSDPINITVDTTEPAKPSLGDVLDDQGAVTGALSDGDTTDDTQPEVQVPLGADVKAGDTIKLYDGTGAVIGEHVVTPAEITAQTASVTPTTPLADGDHTLSVGITDVAGNESDKSDPINITVDTTEPAKPSLGDVLDDQGAVTGALSDGDTTDDTQPEVQVPLGADVKAGDTIKLYDGNGAVIGEHVVTPAEITAQKASVTPTNPLGEGAQALSVSITDAAGLESDKSDPINITIDTTPPAKPTLGDVLDDQGAVTGALSDGDTTDDTQPEVQVPLGADVKAGDTIKLYDGNGAVIGEHVVTPAEITAQKASVTPTNPLGEGAQALSVSITDAAGLESDKSDPINITIDTTPPAKPTLGDVLDDQGAVTGALSDGDTTDDTQPEVQVPLGADVKAGDTIKLYDGNGAVIGEHVVTPAEITAQKASVTPTNPLGEGAQALSVSITDAAGLESDKSDPINITIDTTPPAKPTLGDVLDDQGAVTGALSDGDTTDDTQPEVQVPLGADVKAGDTIKLYDGNGAVIGEHVVTPAEITAQKASVTPTNPLGEGAQALSVSITDAAGLESDKSDPINIIVDTTPPTKPTLGDVLDDQGAVTGALSDGDTTDDTQPEVQVPLGADVKAGDTIKLYDGNGAVIGEHVVTPAEITAQKASVTPTNPLGEGAQALSVSITDAAGLESDKSDPINITIDTTPPAKPTLGDVLDDQGAVTGALSDGDTTDDTQPEVQVPLGADVKAGDTIKLYDGNGAVIGEHVVTPAEITAQKASVTPTNPLGEGAQALSVSITDAAGLESDKSNPINITIDTTAPIINSVGISGATMDQANQYTIDTGDKISFEVIFDELVTVNTTNGTPLIGIKVGNDTVAANYVSGTGSDSDTLTFELPVLESHFDHDGVSINANALDLNGGSITTDYGLDVSTDHDAVVSDPDYRVDAIDLGTNGLLIHGYQADAKWYFAWDKNGDGVHSSGYDKGTWTQANALDGSQDANAQATLNFPSGGEDPRVFGLRPGTAVDDGPTVNTTYDGLLALWDAHNGSGTGTGGTASFNGWFDGTYHGDTQGTGAGYYVAINIGTGQVYNAAVGVPTYIAYEVL